MRKLAPTIILLLTFLLAAVAAKAGTVDAYYEFHYYTDSPLNVRRVTITPLGPSAEYGSAFLSQKPIVYSAATYPSLTNGYLLATNLIAGYAYTAAFSDGFSEPTVTNYFGTNLSGIVGAYSNQVTWIEWRAGRPTQIYGPYYGQTIIFNPDYVTNRESRTITFRNGLLVTNSISVLGGGSVATEASGLPGAGNLLAGSGGGGESNSVIAAKNVYAGSNVIAGAGQFFGHLGGTSNAPPGIATNSATATNGMLLSVTGNNVKWVSPGGVSASEVAAIMATNSANGLSNSTSIKFWLQGAKVGEIFKPTGEDSHKASIVWGSTNNVIGADVYSSVISGGGDASTYSNIIYAPASTVSGGVGSWIFGGEFAHANSIGGGELNRIYSNAAYATISGGEVGRIGDPTGVAIVSGVNSSIGGGGRNFITGTNVNGSTIAGGTDGYIHSKSSVIAGGGDYDLPNNASNSINADFGAILGGYKNYIGTGAPMSMIVGYGVTASTKSIKLGYTNNVMMIVPDGTISGNGSGLTINADNLSQGLVPDARLQGSYSSDLYFLNSGNVIWGAFDAYDSGNGYSLNVHAPASGYGARIGGGLIVTNGIVVASGVIYGNGLNLTNIPASALTNGTTGSGAVALSNAPTINNPKFTGSTMLYSNALSAWPTVPTVSGAAAFVNSNGVVFLLTSGLGATWTATNRIAP